MTTFLSLDPGATTGYAIFEYDEHDFELLESGQIECSFDGFIDAWVNCAFGLPDYVVCESFNLREGLYGVNLAPTYVIGALEALVVADNGRDEPIEIYYQEPKLKPLCDDERLKRLGLHQKGKPHRNDAVRHGIIHLRNIKHKPTLVAGWKE
jgi:hypothetical protein